MSLERFSLRERGFTLTEVLVALALVTIVVLGVAGLIASAVRSAHTARDRTTATILAMQRMEELRGLTWSYEDTEQRVPATDGTTDLSRTPTTQAGRGLAASPANSLDANTDGYVDFLDRHGRWVGTGAVPPASAVYIRRWQVTPSVTAPDHTLLLQVLVTTVRQESIVDSGIRPRPRQSDDALLVTLRTRKVS